MDPLSAFAGVPQVSELIFSFLLLPELETCRSVCSTWKTFLDELISRKRRTLEKRYLRHCWFHKELRKKEMLDISGESWRSILIKDILVYGSRDLLLKLNCASGGMDHREIGYYYRSGILTATFDAHSYKCNYSYRLKVGMTRDYILVKPQSNQIYIYSKDSGQIVQELVPPEDEDDLICLIEAVVDDPGNGVIVVVENLERPGLIKVLTYSDPGVHAESYSSKEIQLSEDGEFKFQTSQCYLIIHEQSRGRLTQAHVFNYLTQEFTAHIDTDFQCFSVAQGSNLMLINDIGRGFKVVDISNGSVLVSKTAQEVIEILPLSRDFVGFKFVGGGDDAEEAGVDGVAGRPEAVIKIWSKSTGFVDPHCPQLEQCIRQAAFQIHIISSHFMLASKSPSQPQAQVTACQVIDLEDGGSESGPSTEYHPLAGRPCPTCSADCDDNPIPIPETDIAQIKFSADGRQGFLVAKYNSSPTSETGGGSGQEQEKKVKSKIYHMKF